MCQMLTAAELSARLRSEGYRVTSQRLAVYEALARSGAHLTPERMLEHVREQHPSMSLNTVYEVLETLTRLGVIRRADVSAGPRRYDANVAPHHHLVCRSCGMQADVPCDDVAGSCLQPPAPAGFEVEEAQVAFIGLCADCRAPATSR